MKQFRSLKSILASLSVVLALVALTVGAQAQEKKEKVKPYPLDKCLVTDEKLGADPGMKPFAFNHEGQEIKLCCKSCQKDFKKDTAKFMKKLKEAEAAKAKEKDKK